MTVVVDTNMLLGLIDAEDAFHDEASAFYADLDEDLVTTPLVVAEMDHLFTERSGRPGAERLWTTLESGAIIVRWWATAMPETLSVVRDRPQLGLADASLLALARIAATTRIATFDRRHFSSARTADGAPFTLLP